MNYNSQTKSQTNLLYSFKFWFLTLILILFYSVIIMGQNVVYIDPTNTAPGQTGSQDHPYSSWDNDITWQDNTTYLQKRGTTITNNSPLIIEFKENITLGAYGDGPKPIIKYFGSQSDVVYISCSSHCTIEGISIIGNIYNTRAGVHVAGFWQANGQVSNDTKIIDCDISNVYNGVRGLKYQTNIDTIGIYNCNIFDCMSDGIFLIDMDSINIINTNIWNINMGWHLLDDGHSQYVSGGDCIQIGGDSHTFTIRNCVLDRRETGNKFCLIYNTGGDINTGRGLVEWNTFYPPKDTIGDDGGSCLYFKWGEKIAVRHNKFIARGYPGGEEAGVSLAHFEVDSIEFAYNMIDNVDYANFAMPVDYASITNNTFVKTTSTNRMIYLNGTTCLAQNNVFALNDGMTAIYNNNGSLTEINNHIVYGNSANWNVDPGFVDWENQNFRLTETSTCTNAGNNYNEYLVDLDSIAVPQGGSRDIGAFEYIDGSQSTNNIPLINNQQFSLPENSANGMLVANVLATDPDAGQLLTYSITAGNTNGAFSINATNGDLSVANTAALNFEQLPAFSLIITVQDNDPNPLSSSATISVNLTDVNEVPEIANQTFGALENTSNGQTVGTIAATDPDNGQSLSFSILSGNSNSAFSLNAASGAITVANSSALDFESTPVFSLTVEVTDNGTGSLSDQATMTINLTDVNEVPEIVNQLFSTLENTSNGQTVGTVAATDPDNGQSLSFSILSGNSNSAFSLNASSGAITVANSSALDFESTPIFSLTVEVTDNGTGSLSDQAIITINLTDVNEVPEIVNQLFSTLENTSNGQTVGTVAATDPDNGQSLSFSILSGNSNGAFGLNAASGAITVANSSALDFESSPVFSLTVEVTDNGTGFLTDQATITINLTDVNEVPEIVNQGFSIAENSSNGLSVGIVTATDPDNGQSLSFSIVSGNSNNAFDINATSGEVTVSNSSALDFESIPVFSLIVEVTDNGTGFLSDQATITINLTDVNEVPGMEDQGFTLDENLEDGTVVGQILAIDPDAGQSLTFVILDGNTDEAFSIDEVTGELTVNNEMAINFELNPVFILNVRVTDNGNGNLWTEAMMVIALFDLNEPPLLPGQNLLVNLSGELIINEIHNNIIPVADLIAIDPDAGQELSYVITAGNKDDIWTLDETSGSLQILNPYNLNPVENYTYHLSVEVSDNFVPPMSMTAHVLVQVNISNAVDFAEFLESLLSGVNSSNIASSFAIMPNPASDQIRISMDLLQQEPVQVSIYTMNGNRVMSEEFDGYAKDFSETLQVNQLETGLYMVCVQQGEKIQTAKLVKQ